VKDAELRKLLKAHSEDIRLLWQEVRQTGTDIRQELREEIRREGDEIRRHIDVRFEATNARFDLVGDGIQNLSEQMKRGFSETNERIDTGFADTQGAVRFGLSDRERRIAALERRIATAKKK